VELVLDSPPQRITDCGQLGNGDHACGQQLLDRHDLDGTNVHVDVDMDDGRRRRSDSDPATGLRLQLAVELELGLELGHTKVDDGTA
jgi:hypothetical protein